MNQGVEILLARMDSNPDEFIGLKGSKKEKWGWFVHGLEERISGGKRSLPFLTEEEVQALWGKLTSLARDLFTHRVMETLLEDGQELSFSSPHAKPHAQVLKELTPGLNALFSKEYDKYSKEYDKTAKLKTTGRYNLDGDLT